MSNPDITNLYIYWNEESIEYQYIGPYKSYDESTKITLLQNETREDFYDVLLSKQGLNISAEDIDTLIERNNSYLDETQKYLDTLNPKSRRKRDIEELVNTVANFLFRTEEDISALMAAMKNIRSFTLSSLLSKAYDIYGTKSRMLQTYKDGRILFIVETFVNSTEYGSILVWIDFNRQDGLLVPNKTKNGKTYVTMRLIAKSPSIIVVSQVYPTLNKRLPRLNDRLVPKVEQIAQMLEVDYILVEPHAEQKELLQKYYGFSNLENIGDNIGPKRPFFDLLYKEIDYS